MCGCKKKAVAKYQYTSTTGVTRTYSSEAEAKLAVKRNGGSWKKV